MTGGGPPIGNTEPGTNPPEAIARTALVLDHVDSPDSGGTASTERKGTSIADTVSA